MAKIFLPHCLILSLSLFGCAHTSSLTPPKVTTPEPLPASLYRVIPPGKSLRETPQFFVVDDFNTRQMKNRLGSPWQVESTQTGSFRFKFTSQNTAGERRGTSLRFKGSLAAGKGVVLKSSLKGLDMSQARAMVFKCRIQPTNGNPFTGKLELTLKDLQDRSPTNDFTSACLSGKPDSAGWQEIVFARSSWGALDWERLQEIAFTFSSGPAPLKAQVGIDEIAFYGTEDVEFQSQRDNLLGFPVRSKVPQRRAALLAETRDERFLYEVARDTWKYFENAVDRNTHLPVDHIRVGQPRSVGSYTTPTNLALYLLACVSAKELGILSKKEAVTRIRETLETLRLMKRWHGFHYNFYNTTTLQVTREYASAVDSGWLAAAMVVLRQAFPKDIGPLASRFLSETDFYEYYDPGIGQLRLGFDEAAGDFSPFHYGLVATEARVASLVGIGKGDLPREHWWFIYRTPPKSWTWQNQTPQGREVDIEKVPVFEGYYTYQGKKFVPSWGGSMFEFLMPALVIKEKELAPKSLGLNNRRATAMQIDYALNRRGYPVWGISPAAVSSGRQWSYREYGVKHLGVKGYKDEGVVAPYASFLALDTLPEQAIDNIRRMLQLYEVYGEYGFYDTITVRNGQINPQYLILDQGMILVAIANYLKGGVIKEYFYKDEIGKKSEDLIGQEQFFI